MAKAAAKQSTSATIAIIAVMVAVGAPFVLGPLWCAHRDEANLEDGDATATGTSWLDAADGLALILHDDVENGDARGVRLRSIDPRTGKRTGQWVRAAHGAIACQPAGAGKAWCRESEGRWLRVDPRTLGDRTDVAAVVKRANVGHIAPRSFEIRRDAAYVTLDDGRVARVDANSLVVTIEATFPPGGHVNNQASACTGGGQIVLSGMPMALQGQPRTAVLVGTPVAEAGEGARRGADFLTPFFVRDGRTGAAIDLGTAALVAHVTSLDPARAKHQLSRVDLTGAVQWTVPLGDRCELVTIADGLIVVTSGGGKPRALAIDPATGDVRWRLDR